MTSIATKYKHFSIQICWAWKASTCIRAHFEIKISFFPPCKLNKNLKTDWVCSLIHLPLYFMRTGPLLEEVFNTKIAFLSESQSKELHGQPNGHSLLKSHLFEGIIADTYLTWAFRVFQLEKVDTWVFAIYIICAVYDTLAQVDTFFLLAGLEVILILRRRIFTTDTNWIWTISTTGWTVDITWAILNKKLRMKKGSLMKYINNINLEHNQWELYHNPGDNLYQSRIECSRCIPFHTGLHTYFQDPRR